MPPIASGMLTVDTDQRSMSPSASPSSSPSASPLSASPGASPALSSPNLAVMIEGRPFTLYTLNPTFTLSTTAPPASALSVTTVVLSYSPSSHKLGSLTVAPSSGAPSTLPVHYISDIYLDQQHAPEWSHLPADEQTSDVASCFTLVSRRRNTQLCLRAESPLIRNAYLAGIQQLFDSGKRTVTSTKKRRSALDVLHNALNASPAVRLMQQGQHVLHLLPPTPLQPVPAFLHYIPNHSKVGSLVWSDDALAVDHLGRLQGVDSDLPLGDVTDVWAGRGGGAGEGGEWEDGRVISVARRGGEVLHVVCESEERRRVWLDGIQEVFAIVARMGKKKLTDEERREQEERHREERGEEEKVSEPAVVQVEGNDKEVVVHADGQPLGDVVPMPTAVASSALPLPSVDALAVEEDASVVGGYTYEVDEAVVTEEKQAVDDRLQQQQRQQRRQQQADDADPPLSSAQAAAEALTAGHSYRYLTEDESSRTYQYTTEDSNGSNLQPASPIAPSAPTDPAASSSPSDPHPAVLALLAGFTFTSYTTTTATTLYLTYNQHEGGRLGTLHYTATPPTAPTAQPPSPLPVASLCDVFVGKQSAELRSPIAAHALASCCFTIASASVALHLCAGSERDKNTFLEGVKQLFLSQGKQVKQQRKSRKRLSAIGAGAAAGTQPIAQPMLDRIKEQQQQMRQTMQAGYVGGAVQRDDRSMTVGPSASAAPVVPVQSREAADATAASSKPPPLIHASTSPITCAPVEPLPQSNPALTHSPPTTPLHYLLTTSPLLSVLRSGAQFTGLFGAPPIPTMAVPLFLFYSPTSSRLGSLHWCDPSRPYAYVPQQSLPLHRLSEVVQGKGSDEMRSVVGGGYKEGVCFSLVSGKRGMGLHLVAKSDKDKREWVEAVRNVFVLSRGGKDSGGAEASAEEERTGAPAAAVSPAANVALLPSVPLDVSIQLLSAGYTLSFAWQAGASAVIQRDERLLWWDETEDGDVQLYWNERLERKRVDGQHMSVHDIDAAWLGKQHNAILAAPELAAIPAEQCVSLVCTRSQQAVHLVAERADSQASFVAALRQVLLHFQTKAKLEGPVPATVITLPLNPLQPLTPAALLTAGSIFLSFHRDCPSPSLLTLAPTYSAELVSIQWQKTDGGSKYGQFTVTALSASAEAPASPRPYGPFNEILAGKRSVELGADVAAAMPADCCLSLIGKEGALHLAAGSEVQRNLWIEAIKAVYAAANKPTAASSAVLQMNDTTLATKLPLLVQGALAIQHLQPPVIAGVKAAVIPPQRVWLAYEPTVTCKGRLTWVREEEKGKAGRSRDGEIDVHEIVGMQAGSADFQHTQQLRVESDRCVSLWTASKRLDVEFLSTVERRAFVSALHSLLLSSRDLTTLHSDTLCVKQGLPKLIINSSFGVCELLHTPQLQHSLPPLIRLTLPWATLSAPPTLPLVKYVAVYSQQGLGFVVLPLDGWGGRTRVEVWMRGAGGSAGVGVVKVLLAVSDVLVIPVMPASMADMVRQLFSGVRHPTPLTGLGGHRGQGSVMAAASLSDSVLLDELNARYNREVGRGSVEPNAAGLVAAAAAAGSARSSLIAPSGEIKTPSGEVDSNAPALPLLRFGHLITLWSGPRHAATAAYVLLYLDEPTNALYWHAVSAPKLITPACTLPVPDVVRAVRGKQTEPLQSTTAAVVPEDCCFALQTVGGGMLSLQASSTRAREEWLLELAQWVDYRTRSSKQKAAGAHKRESSTFVPPSVPPAHRRQPSVPASALFAVGSSATSAASHPFGSGDTFLSYTTSGSPTPIFLLYEPTSSRLGSFYWCDVAAAPQRPLDADRRLPLVSLCDLTIGKGGEGWDGEAGQRADAYRCWSLKTRRVGLFLEASSVEVRDRWIAGIKAIIAADGKRVIE